MTFSDTIQQECKGLSPYHAGKHREQMLAGGLRQLALYHGIKFREPLQIDSNGEFSLVAEHPTAERGFMGDPCGEYGERFAALLSKHNPRTGIMPTKHLHSKDGWCRINHFDVERMLNEGLA